MFFFLKSLSRSVHHQEHQEQPDYFKLGLCKSLTVWRKSLIVSCNGFTVIDSDGNLVYRNQLRLVDSWLVYGGEVGDYCYTSEKPIFYVKKSINILQANPNVLAYVYRRSSDKKYAYMIEGSYSNRSCKVVDEKNRVVAEIRRKAAIIGGISFGLEVFLLIVQPGFDPGFAMALVLLLDQMFS
ncbi:hypothetical protein COLO4_08347 [Corchorus olitorius]|uniref:Uncharacterized protein n=1 Tax=Corchorus olitorius TaxID=93759 RepID=A0A1R3KGA8_9ROSI|nr:hypothetical protein COLO4_08347 [Corchorus olitorius]